MAGVLVCDECITVSEDDDTETVLVLCPRCASALDADAADKLRQVVAAR